MLACVKELDFYEIGLYEVSGVGLTSDFGVQAEAAAGIEILQGTSNKWGGYGLASCQFYDAILQKVIHKLPIYKNDIYNNPICIRTFLVLTNFPHENLIMAKISDITFLQSYIIILRTGHLEFQWVWTLIF